MPQDVTCLKCNHVFPVTEARHPVGVDCPGCDAGLTVEFRKRPAPVEPGLPPYEVLVQRGKPLTTATVDPTAPAPKKLRLDDEDDEDGKEKSSGGGGSMMLVLFAGIGALLLAIGGLGTTGYFLFTNLDTSDATINNLNNYTPAPGGNRPGGTTGGNSSGKPGGNTGGGNPTTPPKKTTFDLTPVTGPIPAINPATLPSESSTIPLGTKVGAVAIAGGGRFIVMHFPDKGQLGVFDANTAQITVTAADTGDVKLAAGLSRIVILASGANIMRVYSVQEPRGGEKKIELRKLYDTNVPVNGLGSIVMGSRTNGPMVGIGTFGGIHLMEIKDNGIKEVEEARKENMELAWGGGILRATPDGLAYLSTDGLDKAKRSKLAYVENHQWKRHDLSHLVPFPGAESNPNLYGNGVVTNLKGIDQKVGGVGAGSGNWYVPAVCGNSGAFLKVVMPSRAGDKRVVTVSIHNRGNANTPADGTPVLSGLPEFDELFDPFGNPAGDKPFDRHFFLFPEAKLLAILSGSKDKLTLRKIDLR